jgi:3-phenylpropionate/trans-cinnamate dioxygenase ferredoxin reductase subunit
MPSIQSSSASAGSPGTDGVLIVGGGQAAMHLASSLRDLGWQAAVTIVSEEAYAPYQRPPLSKAFLSGNVEPATLEFRSAEHYEQDRITVLTGRRVTDVQAAVPGHPGVATTDDGGRLEFGHLALATGARPRRLAVPGADLAGICYLRDIGHAIELRERLAAAQRVLVVGGGFIGLEAAAAAVAKGKTVTVVEAADRLIGRVVAPVISDFYAAAHRRRGVRVLLGTAVSRFEGTGSADTGSANTVPANTVLANTGEAVTGAHLSDGSFVPADLVIIGIGAEPRTELAERLGLACAGGIVVDAFARTSDPAIVAAGDCVVTPHPAAADGSLVRFESYGHAIDHAKVAAATLAGVPARYDAVPWFWSDQGTLKLQIAGLSGGFDQAVLRGDPGQERFSVLYYRGGRLLAVHAVNSPRDYMAVRRALAAGQEIPAESAADDSEPLRTADGQGAGQPPASSDRAGV